jgi:phenylacetate-coenzyme A ligase PaaK-like adenylate-forming protein
LFSGLNAETFEALAMKVFQFQYTHNKLYRQWSDYLQRTPDQVLHISQIPFLPVELFKTNNVICGSESELAKLIFESSGTTGATASKHCVLHPELYTRSFTEGFRLFYGEPSDWRILALLPSYLERSGSSLVYMVNELIFQSNHHESGFFLDNIDDLVRLLQKPDSKKTILIGVSFALLDLAATHPMLLDNTIIMETGGMKGRRKELTRQELHAALCEAFAVSEIHSEYGMTELLSQAYASRNGHFKTPPWMKLLLRDANDPLTAAPFGKTGGINVIDLANLYSCSFIATSDLGKQRADGSIEVLGRFDYSEMRGCNLMVTDL